MFCLRLRLESLYETEFESIMIYLIQKHRPLSIVISSSDDEQDLFSVHDVREMDTIN